MAGQVSPSVLFLTLQKHYLVDTLGLHSLPNHLHEIAFAFILYQVTFTYLAPWFSKRWFPQHYSQLSRRGALDWNLQCVSMVQSILISSLALWALAKTDSRRMTPEQRIWGYFKPAGSVQALAAGYFLWDLIMMTQHLQDLGLPMFIHALSCFTVYMLGFVSTPDWSFLIS